MTDLDSYFDQIEVEDPTIGKQLRSVKEIEY